MSEIKVSKDFKDKTLAVLKAKGYSDPEIEEFKSAIREAWPDKHMRELWINWINESFKIWR